jgi:hypothetical protein
MLLRHLRKLLVPTVCFGTTSFAAATIATTGNQKKLGHMLPSYLVLLL